MAKTYSIGYADGARVIVSTEKRYVRTESGKSWKAKPVMCEVKQIKPEYYKNVIDSIPFFKDRVRKSHTYYGYIPTRLTSVRPDGQVKVVRAFDFYTRVEEAKRYYPDVEIS